MEFSELALPAEEASSAGRALSPAPSALSPACELGVNNDDDHDDNYDNLFRWTSIISLLQTSFQAASTAVPFFTIQTHGKNTADFVFQVLILR